MFRILSNHLASLFIAFVTNTKMPIISLMSETVLWNYIIFSVIIYYSIKPKKTQWFSAKK